MPLPNRLEFASALFQERVSKRVGIYPEWTVGNEIRIAYRCLKALEEIARAFLFSACNGISGPAGCFLGI